MEDSAEGIETDAAQAQEQGGAQPVRLVGYARKGDPRGVRRLYESQGSTAHVEIKVKDIVDPPSGKDPVAPGKVVIWVNGQATVLLFDYEVTSIWSRRWPR
jgi:hypothetical protein